MLEDEDLAHVLEGSLCRNYIGCRRLPVAGPQAPGTVCVPSMGCQDMPETYQPRRAPVHEQVVVRGLRHHVTRWAGEERELVVLLHGWMDTGDTFQFLVDAMSSRHSFVAPDWRGFGRTSGQPTATGFRGLFRGSRRAARRRAPDAPVTLIGHSMGWQHRDAVRRHPAGACATRRVHRGIRAHEDPARAGAGSLPRVAQAVARATGVRELPVARRVRAPAGALQPAPAARPRADFIAQMWTRAAGRRHCARAGRSGAQAGERGALSSRGSRSVRGARVVAPVLYVIAGQSEFLPRLGEDGLPENMARIVRRLEPWRDLRREPHGAPRAPRGELAREIEAFLDRT